jgi:hypothetical protein
VKRVVAAGHGAAAERHARVARLAGEDLDDAADRVRAVERRARPAHHLDAVDLLERNDLEGRAAERGGADPNAVDQQQRVIGVGAADEHRALLAEPAGTVDFDAGEIGEQILHREHLARFDVGTRQHRDREERLILGLRHTRGGNDDLLQLIGRGGRCGRRQLTPGRLNE